MRFQPTSRNVEVEVYRGKFYQQIEFYIVEHRDGDHFLLQPGDDEGWKWVQLEPGVELPEPTIALHPEVAEMLMHGIAEEVMGVEDPVERQSKAEGKLEATERHLDDLRQIIGLDDENYSANRKLEVEIGS